MNNLKETRKRRGLSLRDLEQQTGISNAYLSQLENGRANNPSIDKARVIAATLGSTVDDIFPPDPMLVHTVYDDSA